MPAPADVATVTRAEELLRGGAAPPDVVTATGLSLRSVYRIRERIGAPTLTSAPPSPSPPPPDAAPFTVEIPPIPPGLDGAALDLWLLDERVQAVRTLLHQAQARIAGGGSAHGLAALEGVLSRLLAQRAGVRPPVPPDPGEEERHYAGDADRVVQAIEAGVAAAQGEQRDALRSALAPWPGAYDAALAALDLGRAP